MTKLKKKSLVGWIDPDFIETSLSWRYTFIKIKPPISKQCKYLRQVKVRITIEEIK